MVEFKINKIIRIVCKTTNSRSGFTHVATLFLKGHEEETVRVHYQNRTWERFEYDTVIEDLARKSKSLSDSQKQTVKDWVQNRNGSDDEGMQRLGAIGRLAMVSELMSSTPKAKNESKARILKSVQGIDLPDDWDNLSEDEKQRRLNGAIGVLTKKR